MTGERGRARRTALVAWRIRRDDAPSNVRARMPLVVEHAAARRYSRRGTCP